MDGAAKQKAIIYGRTASQKQADSNGIELQEKTCRTYAEAKGYNVVKVFSDVGVSGRSIERAEMDKLLTFLSEYSSEKFIVLIDHINRLAVDPISYFTLRNEIEQRGGKLESPNFEFKNDPATKLMENMMVMQAEMEENIVST